MRDLNVRLQTRVKGRPALTRSLAGLLIRAHRFARHRATTRADQLWAGRVIDALSAALAEAREPFTCEPHDGRPPVESRSLTMHTETRITRAVENASRITNQDASPASHGLCSHCTEPVRGTRSTVRGTHHGKPFEAVICQTCVRLYVQPSALRRSRAEIEAFWRKVGEYRAAVPLPAPPTTPTRETPHQQHARLRAQLTTLTSRAPRGTR